MSGQPACAACGGSGEVSDPLTYNGVAPCRCTYTGRPVPREPFRPLRVRVLGDPLPPAGPIPDTPK